MLKPNFNTNLINHKLIITVGFLFIALALIILILWPNFQDLKIIQKKVQEKRIELETKEDYLLKLNQDKAKLEEYEEELSKINSALPDSPSPASLFNYLQVVSSESGLILEKIGSFGTSPPGDLLDIQETNFSIGVVGTYASFKDFLLALEKSARLIKVENISSSFAREESLFVFNLRIKVYSY